MLRSEVRSCLLKCSETLTHAEDTAGHLMQKRLRTPLGITTLLIETNEPEALQENYAADEMLDAALVSTYANYQTEMSKELKAFCHLVLITQ